MRWSCFAGLMLCATTTSSGWAQDVLFAINDPADAPGNQSVVDRLEQEFGLTVRVVDDDSPTNPVAEDAEGVRLVIISSTVLSGNVGTAFTDQDPVFRDMEIPTIQWEQALHDEFLFADNGTNVTGESIEITEEGAQHFLAAGLGAGEVFVREGATEFHIASNNNLAEGYEVIAQIGDVPALGVVEPGGLLNDGETTASARRIDMFWGDSSIDGATDEGFMLFDAAISYALGVDPNVTPGDFNNDGSVDLQDFNILAGNFNMQVESFAEGDTDLNRRVDLRDFLAFRAAFAAANAAPATAVPEPSAAFLLVGSIALLLGWRTRKLG